MSKKNTLSKQQFGLRLAKLRETRGFSARQMSLDLGQNRNYINSIESGKNYPKMQNFFEICEYLDITPEDFFRSDNTDSLEQNELLHLTSNLPPDKFHHLLLLVEDLTEESAAALEDDL